MNDYPESDCPWTLYFHGITMPKWSNCWHFQPVADSAVDWYVEEVHGRLDHTGCIESEESDVFVIAAQQVLLQAIDRKEEFSNELDFPPDEHIIIYNSLIEGIQQMITIAEREKVVFWTSGYTKDCEMLMEAIRRFHLGEQNPDYFHPPHRIRRDREKLYLLNGQRKELRRRLEIVGPNKQLKRFIHELKDWPRTL